MSGRVLSVVLMLLSASNAWSQPEETRLISWNTVVHSCRFHRLFSGRVCCDDHHCPSAFCCQLSLVLGGLQARGTCVPRDPDTLLCTRRKLCKTHRECGAGSCCRWGGRGTRTGVCDPLGQASHLCLRRPVYMNRLPILCPCDMDHTCHPTDDPIKGLCVLNTPSTTAAATTTGVTTQPAISMPTSPPTTATTTTTVSTDDGQCLTACPDPEYFCCMGGRCKVKPSLGQSCGVNLCPCRQSVCSEQASPADKRVCQ